MIFLNHKNEAFLFMNTKKISGWDRVYKKTKTITMTRKYIITPFLLSLPQGLFKNRDILDLGCGQADIALNLLKKYKIKSYTGIDILPSAISNARIILNSINGNIKLFVGSAIKLTYKKESFDSILLINLIPLVKEKLKLDKILKESYRVLRNGGSVLLVSTNEKAVLTGLKNKNFKVEMINKNSVPIKYKLKMKRVDNSYIEVIDFCWPTEYLIAELKNVGFKIKKIVDLNNFKVMIPDKTPPFLFIQATK